MEVITCHSTCMQNACVKSGVHAKALNKYNRRLEGLASSIRATIKAPQHGKDLITSAEA